MLDTAYRFFKPAPPPPPWVPATVTVLPVGWGSSGALRLHASPRLHPHGESVNYVFDSLLSNLERVARPLTHTAPWRELLRVGDPASVRVPTGGLRKAHGEWAPAWVTGLDFGAWPPRVTLTVLNHPEPLTLSLESASLGEADAEGPRPPGLSAPPPAAGRHLAARPLDEGAFRLPPLTSKHCEMIMASGDPLQGLGGADRVAAVQRLLEEASQAARSPLVVHAQVAGGARSLRGIRNLGNTCYMACFLQCMFAVQSLSRALLADEQELAARINSPKGWGSNGRLALAFAGLLRAARASDTTMVLNPEALLEVFAEKPMFAAFAGREQQDSDEFGTGFLDGVGDDVSRCKGGKPHYETPEHLPLGELAEATWASAQARDGSVVLDTFAAQLKETFTCVSGGAQKHNFVTQVKTNVDIPDLKPPKALLISVFRSGEPLEYHQLFYEKEATGPLTAAQVCAWLEVETAAGAGASGGGGGGGGGAAAPLRRNATVLTEDMAARAAALINGSALTRFLPCVGRTNTLANEDTYLVERPLALNEPVSEAAGGSQVWVYDTGREGGAVPTDYLLVNLRFLREDQEFATYQAALVSVPPVGSAARTNAAVCDAVWGALGRFMEPAFAAERSAREPPYEVFVCPGPPAAGAVPTGVNAEKRGHLLTYFGAGTPLRYDERPFTKDARDCTLRVVVRDDGAYNTRFPAFDADGKGAAWTLSNDAPGRMLRPSGASVPLRECLERTMFDAEVDKGCACGGAHKKTTTLWRAPPVVFFQLKRWQRNEFTGQFTDRNDTVVDFPVRGLDLRFLAEAGDVAARSAPPPGMAEPDASGCGASLLYDLIAVGEHSGSV